MPACLTHRIRRYRQQADSYQLSSMIVTKTVKGVYQKHGYMNVTPPPKIRPANPAT
jgi:hypothetical protein